MAELADARDSKSRGAQHRVGSTPSSGTKTCYGLNSDSLNQLAAVFLAARGLRLHQASEQSHTLGRTGDDVGWKSAVLKNRAIYRVFAAIVQRHARHVLQA